MFLIAFVGAIAMVFGQSLRTLAMLAAGSAFTHDLAESKVIGHRLVTNGPYQYFRL